MSLTEQFLTTLEAAYFHAATQPPNRNAARLLAEGAANTAESELFQEHVPERWRGAAVGGALSYVQSHSTFAPRDILNELRSTRSGPIRSVQFERKITDLRTAYSTQLLEVLFMERDPAESPLPRIEQEIRDATLATIEFAVSSLPVIGSIYGLYEISIDRSPITNHELSSTEKVLIGLGAALEFAGPALGTARNLRRAMAARIVNNSSRIAPRINYREAYRIATGLDFLSRGDWVRLQEIAASIRAGRITKDQLVRATRLVSRFRTLARAADRIEEIAHSMGNANARGFFDTQRQIRGADTRARDAINERLAGHLLVRLGYFRQIIQLEANPSIERLILQRHPYLNEVSQSARAAVLAHLRQHAKSADYVLDQRLGGEITTLTVDNKQRNAVDRAINRIYRKAGQGNIVIVVNEGGFSPTQMMEVATRFFGKPAAIGDRIIWLNSTVTAVIADFARPPTMDLIQVLEDMRISNFGSLLRGWSREIDLEDGADAQVQTTP